MRALVRKLFQDLDRNDIDWDQESVAFEFLAISCFLNAANANSWKGRCASLPPKVRMDSWCRFPAHSFGRFGRITRRSSIEELVGVLTPRISVEGPGDETLSLYYQGFPPKDVPDERPDWIIVPAKATVRSQDESVYLKLQGKEGLWESTYKTLLGPYGPSEKHESGILPFPNGVIEVSLSKDRQHLNAQMARYKKIYGGIRYVGFLACRVNGSKFPVISVTRSLEGEPDLEECIKAGKEMFDLLMH